MSHEDRRRELSSLWEMDLIDEPLSRPSISPGKRTLTASLPHSHVSTNTSARVQQKRDPAVTATHKELSTQTNYWMNAAVRPDLNGLPVQRKDRSGNGAQTSSVPADGSGQPMPGHVQAKMEKAFDADFSAVRIHQGPEAELMGALAYTQGTHIHFAPGQYAPESRKGQELLGHELTHVVQQGQGRVQTPVQGKGMAVNTEPALEREADEMGAKAAQADPRGEIAASHMVVEAIQQGDPDTVDMSQLAGGKPLDAGIRQQFEGKFAFDLGAIRIYNDAVAASIVERLGALAFSYKNHIAFATGAYQPDSSAGRALIAHELAHYVQTGGAQGHASDESAMAGDSSGGHEAEADRIGQRAAGDDSLVQRLPAPSQADASTRALGRGPAVGYEVQKRAEPGRVHRCISGCNTPKKKATPPSIPLTEKAMGQSNVDQMNELHDPAINKRSETSGVWYSSEYDRYMKQQGKTMDKSWWYGHAPPAYFDKKSGNKQFRLKDKVSASKGVEAFFRGLTIAECYSVMVAMNYRTTLRAVGSAKFDAAFGEAGVSKPENDRMFIQMGLSQNNPLRKFMKRTDAAEKKDTGTMGKRPAKKGEWYYFYNHPHYLLKHPGGSYQGENAFCMGTNSAGEQIWRGFGVSNVTEEQMLQSMMAAYNAARTQRDNDIIARSSNPDLYDWTKGKFKEKLSDWKEILTAPAAIVDGRRRKGGFSVGAGKSLDINAVKKL